MATALEADNVPYDEEKFVFADFNGETTSANRRQSESNLHKDVNARKLEFVYIGTGRYR